MPERALPFSFNPPEKSSDTVSLLLSKGKLKVCLFHLSVSRFLRKHFFFPPKEFSVVVLVVELVLKSASLKAEVL